MIVSRLSNPDITEYTALESELSSVPTQLFSCFVVLNKMLDFFVLPCSVWYIVLQESRCRKVVPFSSVAQLRLTPCDPMDCSMPGFLVHHQLPELAQTHVHPTISSSVVPFFSCLQSFPASGLFQWVSSSHQVAKVLEFQIQHQSFQWIFRTDFL